MQPRSAPANSPRHPLQVVEVMLLRSTPAICTIFGPHSLLERTGYHQDPDGFAANPLDGRFPTCSAAHCNEAFCYQRWHVIGVKTDLKRDIPDLFRGLQSQDGQIIGCWEDTSNARSNKLHCFGINYAGWSNFDNCKHHAPHDEFQELVERAAISSYFPMRNVTMSTTC